MTVALLTAAACAASALLVPTQPAARPTAPQASRRVVISPFAADRAAANRHDNVHLPSLLVLQRSLASAMLSAALLTAPLTQSVLPPAFGGGAAVAKELASGSGSKVNKDPTSLLRLGLPMIGKDVRELQSALEESQDSYTRLLVSNGNSALSKAAGIAKGKKTSIVAQAPANKAAEASDLMDSITEGISTIKSQVQGNQVGQALATEEEVLNKLTRLEELIASGYKQPPPPSEFKGKPWLQGRATVELVMKRDGEPFDVQGTLYDKLNLKMVIDGYTAPLTAGNFVDLVQKGFYTGYHIQRSDGFVVQTGDPSQEGKGEAHGYVPAGASKERRIPLEVYVKGDPEPLYGGTFDDDGRMPALLSCGGYAAALPFNAYGALGMAREEYEPDSASSQWFWLLFDSDLTPAGKNLLDGRYACFGYTVSGAQLLSDVKEGDIIESAKVTSGIENLRTVK